MLAQTASAAIMSDRSNCSESSRRRGAYRDLAGREETEAKTLLIARRCNRNGMRSRHDIITASTPFPLTARVSSYKWLPPLHIADPVEAADRPKKPPY